MTCIANSKEKEKCKFIENNVYNINLFGSKQCITKNDCNTKKGILSPSEDTCYILNKNNQSCSLYVDKNSYYDKTNSKCDCSYKFYYIEEEIGRQKICLDVNGA